jgi:hypothetical protein
MPPPDASDDPLFRDAVQGLRRGDFSRFEPLFDAAGLSRIVEWYNAGYFDDEPDALAEALTCACFLGKTGVSGFLLDHGVDPVAGMGTGMNGFHCAADRGHLDTVEMLIRREVPLEIRNQYGGTVLGTAVWSAIHEPRADHLAIIEALIRAGANLDAVDYPTGIESVDEILRRHGLGS